MTNYRAVLCSVVLLSAVLCSAVLGKVPELPFSSERFFLVLFSFVYGSFKFCFWFFSFFSSSVFFFFN